MGHAANLRERGRVILHDHPVSRRPDAEGRWETHPIGGEIRPEAGTESGKLTRLLPGDDPRVSVDTPDLSGVKAGGYTLAVWAPNSLKGGMPVRFANMTQDADAPTLAFAWSYPASAGTIEAPPSLIGRWGTVHDQPGVSPEQRKK